jgi:anti-anti-sigma regulatory factor
MLFASGKVGETAALLNRYLLDHPENRDPQPWYMLFDLYEASGQMDPFEDAAVDFAVRFERSPPTWAPRTQLQQAAQTNLPQMNFGATFGPVDRPRLQRFMENSAEQSMVRVDMARAPVPDDEYARVMLDCLTALQVKGKAVVLIGGDKLIEQMEGLRRQDGLSELGWLLLLTLLQLSGRQADFEDRAVDYAVRFEVSPPSYTRPKAPPEAKQHPAHAEASGFSFPLVGVIDAGAEYQLSSLKHFAGDKPRVEIDLSQVARIDFACIGLLLDTLIQINAADHKILFKEGNELVNVLLTIVGAGQFAAIVGRTRQ